MQVLWSNSRAVDVRLEGRQKLNDPACSSIFTGFIELFAEAKSQHDRAGGRELGGAKS